MNGLISHSIPTIVGGNEASYERSQELIINAHDGSIHTFSNDSPPKPPTRHHSNINRTSRNAEYGGKSSSRGYSSRNRMEDQMLQALNPEVSSYVDGGQVVVSLPHSWNQSNGRRNQR